MRLTYFRMNGNRYRRALRELLVVLRYRVELYSAVNDEWILKAKVSGCAEMTSSNDATVQGSLGNLGDFEEMLSDCVELSELATIMAADVSINEKTMEVFVDLSQASHGGMLCWF